MKNISEMLKALGDPIRLEIVKLLVGKELCVCDIISSFQVSQPTISHHLKVLKYAGIVKDSREGKWIYYRLDTEALHNIQQFVDEINKVTGPVVRLQTCK